MTCKTILRTTLVAFVALMLAAAPVAATTVADRPAEGDRTIWTHELSDLLTRAWGLLVGERAPNAGFPTDDRDAVRPMSDASESDSSGQLDPDG